MKTYHYERIVYSGFTSYRPDHDLRELINTYAAKGYRYAGFVPVKIVGYGVIKEIELIFEKDEEL